MFTRMLSNNGLGYFIAPFIFATLITALLFGGVEGLEIKGVSSIHPLVIQNGTQTDLVLDCDYSLNESELTQLKNAPAALVVKWYHNDDPMPVYQWVQSKKPQDLGLLKGKLNLEYRASEENATMHRALQIINPTTELSGEYKCTVSFLMDEKSQTKKMIIYVPEKNMEVKQTKLNDNTAVNITCSAEGVYPEPEISIIAKERTKQKHDVEVTKIPRNGVYDAVASVLVNDSDLSSETTFECELKIPETNYTVRKELIYTPGPPTTTTPEPSTTTTELVPEANHNIANRASYSRALVTWLLPMVLFLCLRI